VRPTRDLRRLQRAGLRRLDRLRSIAVAATGPTAFAVERETGVTHCVIELHNCWYSFSRSLYLSSAFRARDQRGSRITLTKVPGAKSVDDALTHAIRRLKPAAFKRRRPPWTWTDEPSWASSKVLLDSLDEIGASNLPTVTAALSLPGATIDNLTPFRHFFAHRGEDTAHKLRPLLAPYAISPALRATEALAMRASGPQGQRPYPLLVDWIDDITNVITLIV
jgi:hypothetical protein